MTAPILTIDTAHALHTGLWTLYNAKAGLSFAFDDSHALHAFLFFWYRNPIAAQFAYHNARERLGPL